MRPAFETKCLFNYLFLELEATVVALRKSRAVPPGGVCDPAAMRPALDAVVPRKAKFPDLAPLLQRIQNAYEPRAVLLFGSRARGDNRPDSDWDLLILLKDDAPEKLLDPYLGWQVRRGAGVSADLLCEYERDFIGDLDVTNTLAYEIKNDAIQLA